MVSKIMLKFLVSGMVAGGERKKPKHVMNDDDGQFSMSWLSTPKYPKGNDNGASDDGYYHPDKEEPFGSQLRSLIDIIQFKEEREE